MQTTTSWEEKGMKKGIKKERETIALNMLRKNMSIETISELTGLTLKQLQKLQTQIMES